MGKIKIQKEKNMNCKKAKQIDLVLYLKKQGFKTGKTTTNEVWFYSSFRRFAKQFCFQVHYSFSKGKEYYGIGFMNNKGGLEIRNQCFKGCLGKKEITTINNNSDVVSMFESWSDFLSYLTLKKDIPKENFIILNSTSMIDKAFTLLENYKEIKLLFDNDEAGNRATNFINENIKSKTTDKRNHYKNYNDLNEFLVNQK